MSLHCNVNWRNQASRIKKFEMPDFCFSVRRVVRAKGSVLNAPIISLNKNLAKLRGAKQHMACICTPNTPSPASPPVWRPKMLKTSLGPFIYDSYISIFVWLCVCLQSHIITSTTNRCVLYDVYFILNSPAHISRTYALALLLLKFLRLINF